MSEVDEKVRALQSCAMELMHHGATEKMVRLKDALHIIRSGVPEFFAQPDTVPRAAEIDEVKVRADCKTAWMALPIDVRERAKPGDFERFEWGYLARAREDAALHAQQDVRIMELEHKVAWCESVMKKQVEYRATLEARLKEIESAEVVSWGVLIDGEFYSSGKSREEAEQHVGSFDSDARKRAEVLAVFRHQPAQLAAQVPDGWQLVPKKPTAEMAREFWRWCSDLEMVLLDAWKSMLAAAPKPEDKP